MGLLDYLQNQKPVTRKGEGSHLRQQFPKLYGALGGLLGTAPDEFEGSVLDPLTAEVRKGAEMGYIPGLIAGGAPPIKGAAGLAGLAGMFVGKGSKTWDAVQATRAMELEKAGVDARKIWSETGTWKAPDGAWRQEIPDNAATLNKKPLPTVEINGKKYEDFKLPDALNHNQLFEAYPDAKNISGTFQTRGTNGASYTPAIDSIQFDAGLRQGIPSAQQIAAKAQADAALRAVTNNSRYRRLNPLLDRAVDDEPEFMRLFDKYGGAQLERKTSETAGKVNQVAQDIRENPAGGAYLGGGYGGNQADSVALHEVQHAIQQREGFAMGGNPDNFTQQDVAQKARDMLFWQREVKSRLDKNPSLDWRGAEAEAAKDYQSIGWPEAVPSDEIRKMAVNPLEYFGDQPEEFVKLYGLDKRTTPYTSNELYKRLAGEAEARATQARIPLDATARRQLFPADSYDVPMDQLIIRGLLK